MADSTSSLGLVSIRNTGQELTESMPTPKAAYKKKKAVAERKKTQAQYFTGVVIVVAILVMLITYFVNSSGSDASEAQFDEVWNIFENDCKCQVSSSAFKKIKNLEKHQIGYTNKLFVTILCSTAMGLLAVLFCYWENHHVQPDLEEAFEENAENTAGALVMVKLMAAAIDKRGCLEDEKKKAKEFETRLKSSHDEEKIVLTKKFEESQRKIGEIQESLNATQQELSKERNESQFKDSELQELKAKEEAAFETIRNLEKSSKEKGASISSSEQERQSIAAKLAAANTTIRQLERALSASNRESQQLKQQLRSKVSQLEESERHRSWFF